VLDAAFIRRVLGALPEASVMLCGARHTVATGHAAPAAS
jgi:hypothetical protein